MGRERIRNKRQKRKRGRGRGRDECCENRERERDDIDFHVRSQHSSSYNDGALAITTFLVAPPLFLLFFFPFELIEFDSFNHPETWQNKSKQKKTRRNS